MRRILEALQNFNLKEVVRAIFGFFQCFGQFLYCRLNVKSSIPTIPYFTKVMTFSDASFKYEFVTIAVA